LILAPPFAILSLRHFEVSKPKICQRAISNCFVALLDELRDQLKRMLRQRSPATENQSRFLIDFRPTGRVETGSMPKSLKPLALPRGLEPLFSP